MTSHIKYTQIQRPKLVIVGDSIENSHEYRGKSVTVGCYCGVLPHTRIQEKICYCWLRALYSKRGCNVFEEGLQSAGGSVFEEGLQSKRGCNLQGALCGLCIRREDLLPLSPQPTVTDFLTVNTDITSYSR